MEQLKGERITTAAYDYHRIMLLMAEDEYVGAGAPQLEQTAYDYAVPIKVVERDYQTAYAYTARNY